MDAFASFELERSDTVSGDVLLRNVQPVPNADHDVMDRFDMWVAQTPDQVFVSQLRGPGPGITYGEASARADMLGAALTRRGLSAGAVVAAVAEANCDHAMVKLACLRGGMVHVPIAPANLRTEFGRKKIEVMFDICKPDLVVGAPEALAGLKAVDGNFPLASLGDLFDTHSVRPQPSAHAHNPKDLAAIYFTSGSTGTPKGVMITRGMIAAVQSRVAAHWPFLAQTKPVLVDWLPWHHVFGGLDNFFKIIWNGGTYHIRPIPKREDIAEIAAKIAQLRPTIHTDVPFGISLLLDQLEAKPHLLAGFLDRLELIFFAGAGMDGETWKRLNRLIPKSDSPARLTFRLASGYGSTEAGSTICLGHERPASPGEIGIPLPGTELRLVETDGRREMWVRGPQISPGYLSADGPVPMPLDDKGFLMTGDTATALRPDQPEMGMVFDGRLAEDFKLTNGARVKVGMLRQLLLSVCSPYLDDVAIAGESEPFIGVLLFPSHLAQSLDLPEQNRIFAQALSEHNTRWPGSSMAVRRAIVQASPANAGNGESNDKGHLVQRRTLKNRSSDAKRLFAPKPDAGVIVPQDSIS